MRQLASYALVAAMLGITPLANAQTFDGDAADGLWETPTNWVGDALPGGNTNIGDGFTVSLSSDQTIGELDLAGDQTGGDATLNHSSGTLAGGGWMKVGGSDAGTYNLSGTGMGAAASTGHTRGVIGFAGGNGTLSISGDASVIYSEQFSLASGQTENGGVGNDSIGTLNISDNGSLTVGNFSSAGTNSTAVVNQTGGSLTSNTWVAISNFNDGTGNATYNISGGSLSALNGNIAIGQDGIGTLDVSGDANVQQAAGGLIFIGGGLGMATADGTLNITGSAATVSGVNLQLAEVVGSSGTINWVADAGGITSILTGATTFGPGTSSLSLDLSADPLSSVLGTEYTLVDGTAGVAGTFTGIGEGSIVNFIGGTGRGRLSYVGGDGFDIVLTVIPEPSTAILFGAGALGLVLRRRRS